MKLRTGLIERHSFVGLVRMLWALPLLTRCMFNDVREQQAAMQRACVVGGTVELARKDATCFFSIGMGAVGLR
jgi:hypothetical protein